MQRLGQCLECFLILFLSVIIFRGKVACFLSKLNAPPGFLICPFAQGKVKSGDSSWPARPALYRLPSSGSSGDCGSSLLRGRCPRAVLLVLASSETPVSTRILCRSETD